MNYLAHAYLSFGHPEIMLGNMISDFIKGKKKFDYPLNIQKGIALHRAIDSYTDSHEGTRSAKEIFRPVYRLYSGALTDVVFDHFLATDPTEFSEISLSEFCNWVYSTLEENAAWFPEKFRMMFPYMQSQNWLLNYQYPGGIEKSLGGVARRARYLSDSGPAFELFKSQYQLLGECYRHLWKDLKPFALQEFELLTIKSI